jgi:hypothetical protein
LPRLELGPAFLIAGFLINFAACVPRVALHAPIGIAESEAALSDYEKIFPIYGEFCGHTQIKKKEGHGRSVTGNEFGHGGLYLKGACTDLGTGYPLLRECTPGDAQAGAGISTDYAYQSVSWIASPDRHFYYWGDLQPGEKFTWERDLEISSKVISQGMFTGVTPSQLALQKKPADAPLQAFMLDDNFGTDYALNLARSSACVRVPLSREMLARMIDFLNRLNRRAHVEGNPFSGFGNNCVHTWHNALAEVGFWAPIKTNRPFPLDLFDLAVPFNQVADLIERTGEIPVDDPLALFHDEAVREMLLKWGRLPAGPGILLEEHAIVADNEVFHTDAVPALLDPLGLGGKAKGYQRALADPALFDLKENLIQWRARLIKLQAARKQRNEAVLPKNFEFREFLIAYDRWVDERLAELADH